MEYVRLGSSGLKVSRICLGMMSYGDPGSRAWHLGEEEAEPIVRRAVDAGVMFFDTADMYSGGMSEEITGRLLGNLFPNRDDYVLATKVYFPTGTCNCIRRQLRFKFSPQATSASFGGGRGTDSLADFQRRAGRCSPRHERRSREWVFNAGGPWPGSRPFSRWAHARWCWSRRRR
jgi:Aldo/keto reductase family